MSASALVTDCVVCLVIGSGLEAGQSMAPVSAVPLSPVVDESEAQTLVQEGSKLTSRGDNVTGMQDDGLAEQVGERVLEVLVGDGHVEALEALHEHRAAQVLDVRDAGVPRCWRG